MACLLLFKVLLTYVKQYKSALNNKFETWLDMDGLSDSEFILNCSSRVPVLVVFFIVCEADLYILMLLVSSSVSSFHLFKKLIETTH